MPVLASEIWIHTCTCMKNLYASVCLGDMDTCTCMRNLYASACLGDMDTCTCTHHGREDYKGDGKVEWSALGLFFEQTDGLLIPSMKIIIFTQSHGIYNC